MITNNTSLPQTVADAVAITALASSGRIFSYAGLARLRARRHGRHAASQFRAQKGGSCHFRISLQMAFDRSIRPPGLTTSSISPGREGEAVPAQRSVFPGEGGHGSAFLAALCSSRQPMLSSARPATLCRRLGVFDDHHCQRILRSDALAARPIPCAEDASLRQPHPPVQLQPLRRSMLRRSPSRE